MNVTVRQTGSLEDSLAELNRGLAKGQKQAANEVAKTARKVILAEVKTRRRGGLSFSGMNTRLTLSTKTESQPTSATTILRGKPAGPWAIVEYGAEPHEQKPKRGKRALYFDGIYSAHVAHPGARAQKVWDQATAAADEAIGRDVEAAFDDAIGAV